MSVKSNFGQVFLHYLVKHLPRAITSYVTINKKTAQKAL